MKKLLTAIFVVAMAFATMHAEAAKRMGGGKSMGQQSSNVTQREAAKPAPAATPNAAPAARRNRNRGVAMRIMWPRVRQSAMSAGRAWHRLVHHRPACCPVPHNFFGIQRRPTNLGQPPLPPTPHPPPQAKHRRHPRRNHHPAFCGGREDEGGVGG